MAVPPIGLPQACARLAGGHAVTFPTDTVVGLALSPFHASSPEELYRIKGRPADKPISWLVPCIDDLSRYGADVPEEALALACAFWPGPLTIVVRAASCVPAAFVSRTGTIGLRMPDHPVPLALMGPEGIVGPLATTSANSSGGADTADATRIDAAISVRAPLVGIAGPLACESSSSHRSAVASTVVDCTHPSPRILRMGSISMADMETALI